MRYQCPTCHRIDRLSVEATAVFKLGRSILGEQVPYLASEPEWTPKSHMVCDACGTEGPAREFEHRADGETGPIAKAVTHAITNKYGDQWSQAVGWHDCKLADAVAANYPGRDELVFLRLAQFRTAPVDHKQRYIWVWVRVMTIDCDDDARKMGKRADDNSQ